MSNSSQQQKQFLVTGGCGFIGSHITDQLIKQGHQVIVVDDLSTGRMANLNPNAKFFQGDVSDRIFLDKVFRQHSIDYVIHQAAKINTNVLHESPSHDVCCTVLGTINLAECCLSHNVDRLIFASSVAVYGRPKKMPVCEVVQPEPIYSYGIAKLCAEKYLDFYSKNHGLHYHALRYSNVYGPRQPIYGEVGVIAIFTDRIINNKSLTVYGDGQHVRDFIYVSDIVRACIMAMETDRADYDVFNLGSGKPLTIREIAQTIAKVYNSSVKPNIMNTYRKGDVRHCFADIGKIKNRLGFEPEVDFYNGIKKLTEWAKTSEAIDRYEQAQKELKEKALV